MSRMPRAIGLVQSAYRRVARPACFYFDSEPIHDFSLAAGRSFSALPGIPPLFRRLFHFHSPRLVSHVADIYFENPTGLAAGFDHEGRLTRLSGGLGFGFESMGTVTFGAYAGNEYPRIKRAVKSQSILVNKGFKSRGMRTTLSEIGRDPFDIPIGLSVGQTNTEYRDHAEAIADVERGFTEALESGIPFSYFELNISCPNLKTPISFYNPARLDDLLRAVTALPLSRPLFIKMPISLSDQETLSLVEVVRRHAVSALIIGNLQTNRADPAFDKDEVASFEKFRGNWSGKPCAKRSDELIRLVYEHTRGELPIIGCGGVFSAEDAYRKIRLGASLVQLATALIFEGPLLPAEINVQLAELLLRDGYANVAEAVGADVRAEQRV